MADPKTNVLILTATIAPPTGAIKLARTDPKMRLSDYRKALEFYLSCLANGKISGLMFAENSAYDITELRNLCAEYGMTQKTEFISFRGLDYPPDYGRGYGEFKMIDYVMENSQIIQQLQPQAIIWKITGRYILDNLEKIIRTRPSDADFYCHCRNTPIRWVDLYTLCWNKGSYDAVLKNIYQLIREDNVTSSAEQSFRKLIDEQNFEAKKIKAVKRFRTLPELKGTRGLDTQSYQSMNMKLFIRKATDFIVPWLWI